MYNGVLPFEHYAIYVKMIVKKKLNQVYTKFIINDMMSSSKMDISHAQYITMLKESWDVKLSTVCFPPAVTQWIERKCRSLGVPFQYVAYPLMTGVSYCLGESYVEVFNGYREPIILYTIVSGRSGTNKSGSLSKINKFMYALPKEGDEQHVFDVGSMEGLLSALKDNKGNVYCAVDELKAFLDVMDKNGGHAERCRYLSLWSGLNWSKRTKGSGNNEVRNPRFNFTSFNQNYFLMELLLNNSHYDGFLPRFLVATPDEVFIGLDEKIDASKEHEPVNMRKLFRQLYGKFRNGCIFVFDDEALEIFKMYDQEVLDARREDRFDDMKSMVLAKSVNNLIRVAAIQCALRSAVHNKLSNVEEMKKEGDNVNVELINEDISSTYTVTENKEDDNEYSDDSDDDDEEYDPDDAKRNTVNIIKEDINNALIIIKYSTKCILTLVNSTKNNGKEKKGIKRSLASSIMPDNVHMIDEEFLLMHRAKIQKVYELSKNVQNTDPTNQLKVKISIVTRNHLYPQSTKFCAGTSGGEKGKLFLMGMEKCGLGKVCDNGQYFELIDMNDTENIAADILGFMNKLGLHTNIS